MKNLQLNSKNEISRTVDQTNTAKSLGSGGIEVFATPYMIALMEQSSMLNVQCQLEDGFTTVGTKVNIEHISATPVGMKVFASSILTGIDGRKLTFDVKCWDEKSEIGFGTHERFIIETEKFMTKVNSK